MVLVDVREPNETAVERFPDAVLVPLSDVRCRPPFPDPAGREVVFACRSGRRSVTASLAAQEQGFRLWRRISPAASWPGRPPGCRPRRDDAVALRFPLRVAAPVACAIGAMSIRCRAGAPKERVVNYYNWSDYQDPTVLDDFHQADRHQGSLRHVRFQRHAGGQALAGQSGYDVVVPTRLFSRAPDQRRHFSEARQVEAAQSRLRSGRRSPSGSPSTIPAITTPSITCGARPASATTSRR